MRHINESLCNSYCTNNTQQQCDCKQTFHLRCIYILYFYGRTQRARAHVKCETVSDATHWVPEIWAFCIPFEKFRMAFTKWIMTSNNNTIQFIFDFFFSMHVLLQTFLPVDAYIFFLLKKVALLWFLQFTFIDTLPVDKFKRNSAHGTLSLKLCVECAKDTHLWFLQ